MPLERLSSTAKLYVGCVILAGLTCVAHSAVDIWKTPPERGWWVLAVLTLLTGSLTLRVTTIRARISVSEVFVFASVLWFGPAFATFVVALEALVGTLWMRSRTPVRTLFNLSAAAFAMWSASHLYLLVSPGSDTPRVEDLLV